MAVGSVGISCFSLVRLKEDPFSFGLRKALIFATLLTLFPLLFMLLKGAITYHCDLQRGMLFYLMGPFASAVFAFSLALFLSSFKSLARTAFVGIFCVSFAFNLCELYFTPAIFFYNPFLGFYPGAIYDVAIEVSQAYWAFRGFCLILSISFFVFGYLRFRPSPKPKFLLYAGLFALVCAIAMFAMGSILGFRGSRSRILSELDHVVADPYCIIRHDASLDQGLVRLLLEECSLSHKQSASFFGVDSAPPVEIFLYKDDEQKAKLMGARDVEVSKPWLNQVHIAQVMPHQKTLAHEIAHVVAGRLLSNPLKIPLRYGFIPDMALVEGIAVAFAFYDDAPSPHEEAFAYLKGGQDKAVERVAKPLGFVLEKPEKAYLLMGSLLRFIRDHYGLEAFKTIVRGGTIGTGASKDRYPLQEWVRFLETEGEPTVTKEMVISTASLLSGPGVLGIRCHADIAYLIQKANQSFASLDVETAKRLIERARRMDPLNERAMFESLKICAWAGEEGPCDRTQQDEDAMTTSLSLECLIALADAKAIQSLLKAGDVQKPASLMFHRALSTSSNERVRRSVLARLDILDMPAEVALLAYKAITGFGNDPLFFLEEAVIEMPDSKTIHYLLARGLCAEGDYMGCLSHSQIALSLGMDEDFYLESMILSFRCAFFARNWALARRLGDVLLEKAQFKGQREWVKEILERMSGF
jgi:hypothetical protein